MGVIVHIGHVLHSGHFISYVKHGFEWFLFDDAKVKFLCILGKTVLNVLSPLNWNQNLYDSLESVLCLQISQSVSLDHVLKSESIHAVL